MGIRDKSPTPQKPKKPDSIGLFGNNDMQNPRPTPQERSGPNPAKAETRHNLTAKNGQMQDSSALLAFFSV
jgi:hypothetical protein